jgi:inorganic pyrophosphatase/exopolyphosphatase
MQKVHSKLVTSYINPDTDGIACSIALANLLTFAGEAWVAVYSGKLSDETKYVLNYLDIPEPDEVDTILECDSIALVDTHHKAQLLDDFPYEKVQIIVDHHPNGDADLFRNAQITNKMVGAAATIIADMYLEKNIYDKKMLALLGFAILSNTMNFLAPSTTNFDLDTFDKIQSIVKFDNDAIFKMFQQRSLILKGDLKSAFLSDFKLFETKYGKVGISQLEVFGLSELLNFAEAVNVINGIATAKRLKYCLFNGVDIKLGKSYVICANEETRSLLKTIFDIDSDNGALVFGKILLRKADFAQRLR